MRCVLGSRNAPAKEQQPSAVAVPTAGCCISGAGYGYPSHVGALLLTSRVLAQPRTFC